jgi:uncharacterized membrane protein YgcG
VREPESTSISKPQRRFTLAQVVDWLSAACLVLGIGIAWGARVFCTCVSPAVNRLTIVLLVAGFAGLVLQQVVAVRGQPRQVIAALMAATSLGLAFSVVFAGVELNGPVVWGVVISGAVAWLAHRGRGGGGGTALGGDFSSGGDSGGGDGGGAC